MKKSIINLRHPQHLDIRHPLFKSFLPRNRNSLFAQLSQQIITTLMSYLRLADIVILYNSIKYCHKYEQVKRSILNYLILSNRIYTKWEQKQFLDILINDMRIIEDNQHEDLDLDLDRNRNRNKQRRNYQNRYENNGHSQTKQKINMKNSLYINLNDIRNYKYNPSLHITPISGNSQISNNSNNNVGNTVNENQNINEKHHINQVKNNNKIIQDVHKNNYNNFKQSIVYDVNRTYFRKTRQNWQRNKDKQQRQHKQHKLINSETINQQSSVKTKPKTDENRNINTALATQNNLNNINNTQIHTQRNPYFITVSTQQSQANLHPQTRNISNNQYNNKFRLSASSSNSHTHTHTQSRHHLISNQTNQQNISTNSQIQYFTSQQQKMQLFLKNVLLNISQKYQMLGYIQGFNYIVKNMYLTGFTEEQAYKYLSYLIQHKHLGNIILNNMVGIRQLSYVLKVYIFNYVPLVYRHLIKAQLQPEIFSTSWFITLFSEELSCDVVNKLWHIFILEGWKMFIKFGISLICAYQTQILSKGVDDVFSYMRKIIDEFNNQVKDRVRKSKYVRNYITKKEEIVWKLMMSVEVSDNIMSQLCREMNNLEKDSQIQIWRLQTNSSIKNLHQPRNRTFSQKSLSLQDSNFKTERPSHFGYDSQYQRQGSSLSSSLNAGLGERLCCDRMTYVDNFQRKQRNSSQVAAPRSNMFALCHNVGAYD